jgi:hypothetical protein
MPSDLARELAVTAGVAGSMAGCFVAFRASQLTSNRFWRFPGVAHASTGAVGLFAVMVRGGALPTSFVASSVEFFVGWTAACTWAITALLALRPLLGSRSVRPQALVVGVAIIVAASAGIIERSALINRPSTNAGRPELIAQTVALLVAAGAWLSGRTRMLATRRGSEALVLLGCIVHFAGDRATSREPHHAWLWMVTAFASCGLSIRATSQLGSSTSKRSLNERMYAAVRPWPAVVAFFLAGALSSARFTQRQEALRFGLFLALTGLLIFCGRELRSGYKPNLIPFTKRERAAHQIFLRLLNSELSLAGRAVRRSTDYRLVAVEAHLRGHRVDGHSAWSIQAAAKDARVETELLEHTVRVGLANAQALVSTMAGGEPWLSVPIDASALDPRLHATFSQLTLDGLVLRIQTWPTPYETEILNSWRDRGAWVQIEDPYQTAAIDFEADIVTVDRAVDPRWSARFITDPNAKFSEKLFRLGGSCVDSRVRPLETGKRVGKASFFVDTNEPVIDARLLIARQAVSEPAVDHVRLVSSKQDVP